jgi:2-keto-4-pentenoate hydratase/2-oxohepta-3-ene-1,7-dioic acid hydratase in catechol pathway
MSDTFKLITYQAPNGPRVGLVRGDSFVDAAEATGHATDANMLAILDDWADAQSRLSSAADRMTGLRPVSDVTLLAPVHYPVTIFCAGANYTDHVERMAKIHGFEPDPDPHTIGLKPWHFIKPSRNAVGDKATISVASKALDWEAELALVIGRRARNVSIEDALSYVAAYTIANDVSARDLSRRPHLRDDSPFKYDWVGQKCFDGSCPLGPWLVPARDVPDPQNLSIRLWVNDRLRQDSNTGKMIFTAAEQISHLSSRLTLHPGDVILTGTPMGVGAETKEFLAPGDVMRVEIEKLGVLVTSVAG